MNKFVSAVLAVALSATSVTFAHADDELGHDWMPAQQVLDKVLKSGYTDISKIEAEDGQWEGKGRKNGQKMKFYADPKTGEITSEKPDR
jgi:hypothetical protein